MKSTWRSRFLIKTIMGLIRLQEMPNGAIILTTTTAAIRRVFQGVFQAATGKQEAGIYRELKYYALERVSQGGHHKSLMECYLMPIHIAEREVWVVETNTEAIGKHNSVTKTLI